MSTPSILIIEDEQDIRDLIALQLLRAGYAVLEAASAEAALPVLEKNAVDLIVVDWMLPQMSGVEMISRLRQTYSPEKLSILMVTAKGEPEDVVRGLEAGADDYVVKPFEMAVLTARVKALLRRTQALPAKSVASRTPAKNNHLVFGALVIKPEAYEVKLDQQTLDLTPSEFKLLLALAENRGKVLTRNRIIELVQGEGIAVIDRAVDTHVFGLRKKLGAAADLIETVRGVGYRIRWEDTLP